MTTSIAPAFDSGLDRGSERDQRVREWGCEIWEEKEAKRVSERAVVGTGNRGDGGAKFEVGGEKKRGRRGVSVRTVAMVSGGGRVRERGGEKREREIWRVNCNGPDLNPKSLFYPLPSPWPREE